MQHPDIDAAFGLIGAEADLLNSALIDAAATTGIDRFEALETAIDNAFAVLELIAPLRGEFPDQADTLSHQYRGLLLRLRDMQKLP
jgi:hypothetical protein